MLPISEALTAIIFELSMGQVSVAWFHVASVDLPVRGHEVLSYRRSYEAWGYLK